MDCGVIALEHMSRDDMQLVAQNIPRIHYPDHELHTTLSQPLLSSGAYI